MATRATAAANRLGDWEMTEDLESSDGYTIWENSQTAVSVKLAGGLKPTKKILDTLAMNMPDMSPNPHQDDNVSSGDLIEADESPVTRVLTILGASDRNGRAEVKVYRQLAHSGERYCGMFTPEQFEMGDIELIRKNWGGGRYRIAVYGTTAKTDEYGNAIKHGGKFTRMGQQYVEIEEMRLEAVTAPGSGGGVGNDALTQLLTQMNNRINELSQAPQTAAAAPDMMEQFERFARIQKMMGGETKKQTVVEQIKEMEAMLGLRKKLDSERGDGDGKEKTMMDLAGDVLPLLKEIVSGNGNNAQAQQIPQLVTPPALAAVQTQEPIQSTGEDEVNAGETFMLNIMVGAILQAAERGDPTEKHAPGLAEKLPTEAEEILDNPLWFEMLCETLPKRAVELKKHQAWFSKLRDEIIAVWDAEPPIDTAG